MNWQEPGMSILVTIWRVSWQASVLAAIILAFRFIFGGGLIARWRCRLWILVAVRLMLPVLPSSPWSVFNLLHPSEKANHDAEIELPSRIIITSGFETPTQS